MLRDIDQVLALFEANGTFLDPILLCLTQPGAKKNNKKSSKTIFPIV